MEAVLSKEPATESGCSSWILIQLSKSWDVPEKDWVLVFTLNVFIGFVVKSQSFPKPNKISLLWAVGCCKFQIDFQINSRKWILLFATLGNWNGIKETSHPKHINPSEQVQVGDTKGELAIRPRAGSLSQAFPGTSCCSLFLLQSYFASPVHTWGLTARKHAQRLGQ